VAGERDNRDIAATTTPVRETVSDLRGRYERYEEAFAGRDAPFAFVDLDAMWANAGDLLLAAAGKPIRVATKSIRCRPLTRAILDRDPGFRGLMTFTLAETLWLGEHGFDDALLAYPTTDRGSLARLAALDAELQPALVVDSVDHLDLIDDAVGSVRPPTRVVIEVDLAYALPVGGVKIGAKRSPIRTPEQASELARAIVARPGFELAGIMGYEAHIAGVGDQPRGKRVMGTAIRLLQKASAREIARRRAAVVDAVRAVAPTEIVNGGGTGSVAATAAEPAVTEVTAGSGFYAPTLFDHYSSLSLRPAAMYALPVVRKPSARIATALGGGYTASGAADATKLPEPYLPHGLKLDATEGAGEVQTPLVGPGAAALRVGDRVYMRHAKAGELSERFDSLLVVENGAVVDELPTYRGEGKTFL
jgi:D-serine deaminase-like pyridoxal phosphate-dependent protein